MPSVTLSQSKTNPTNMGCFFIIICTKSYCYVSKPSRKKVLPISDVRETCCSVLHVVK